MPITDQSTVAEASTHLRLVKSPAEEWRPVAGFEGLYEVSSLGRVRSVARTVVGRDGVAQQFAGRLLNPAGDRYLHVSLSRGAVRTQRYVHRLVAQTFLPAPAGPTTRGGDGFQVNHIDGEKTNNRADNLEWVTQSQNMTHALDLGLNPQRGEGHHAAHLTAEAVAEIRRRYRPRVVTQQMLADEFGVARPTVSRIIAGKLWASVPATGSTSTRQAA